MARNSPEWKAIKIIPNTLFRIYELNRKPEGCKFKNQQTLNNLLNVLFKSVYVASVCELLFRSKKCTRPVNSKSFLAHDRFCCNAISAESSIQGYLFHFYGIFIFICMKTAFPIQWKKKISSQRD